MCAYIVRCRRQAASILHRSRANDEVKNERNHLQLHLLIYTLQVYCILVCPVLPNARVLQLYSNDNRI